MKKIYKFFLLVILMFVVGCGVDNNIVEDESKIKLYVNKGFGSMFNEATFLPFTEAVEKNTGLSIKIEKMVDYYTKLPILFAVGEYPDLFEIDGMYYPTYGKNEMLWDMSDAWDNSAMKKSGQIDERFIQASMVDGKLYGFPVNRGNGSVTYIRKDWLDNLGLEVPSTYHEFLNVLKAFREDDPDGNGIKDTFGLTAAGVLDVEPPYDIFLREFYQDAIPDFYIKNGVYVDGMGEVEMIEALKRLKFAYENKYFDPEILTNSRETALNKFYAGMTGVISYWAGNWNMIMEENLKLSNPEAELVPIPPIEGIMYFEKPPTMLAIYEGSKNPQELFDKLIEYSYDGGEGQVLFTRGVENINYFKVDKNIYVQLENPENPNGLFEKTLYSPELLVSNVEDIIGFDSRITNSLEILNANSIITSQPIVGDNINENIFYLNDIKALVISDVMLGKITPEEGIKRYKDEGGEIISFVLSELNKNN